jgi:hypothetical protein
VWLLEPEASLATVLVELFEDEGFVVRACGSTAELTRECLLGDPGVVVVDLDEVSYRDQGRQDTWFDALSRLVPVVVLTAADPAALPESCHVAPAGLADLEPLVALVRGLVQHRADEFSQLHGAF